MNCDTCKYKVTDKETQTPYCATGNPAFISGGKDCDHYKLKPAKKEIVKQEPTQAGKEQIKKLKQSDALDFSIKSLLANEKRSRLDTKFIPYPISLKDAKLLFQEIYEHEVLKRRLKVSYTEPIKSVLNLLLPYWIGQDGALSPRKGIYLHGGIGRGKTILMRSFQKFSKRIEDGLTSAGKPFTVRSFKAADCMLIVKKVDTDKSLISLPQYYNSNWCLDDICSEDNLKQWGNELNIINQIITFRYDRINYSNDITHCTSNIGPDSPIIISKYGERIESRFHELFHFVELGGSDLRKQ